LNILSLFAFFASITYLYVGIYSLKKNLKENINIVFFFLSLSLAVWALGMTFFYSAKSKEECLLLTKYFKIGLYLYPAFLLHFFLLLTKNKNKIIKFLIYIPQIVFYIKSSIITTIAIKDFVYLNNQWHVIYDKESLWYYAFFGFMILYHILSFLLLLKWFILTKTKREKKQALIIMISFLIMLILGIIFGVIFPFLELMLVPHIAPIIISIWVFGIWFSIINYNLFESNQSLISNYIITNSADLIIIANSDGYITKANNKVKDLLRFSDKDLEGKLFSSIIEENEFELIKNNVGNPKTDYFSIKNYEIFYKTKNNDKIPINITVNTIKDKFDDRIGYIIIGNDITASKQLIEEIRGRREIQENLLESESRYKTLVENIPDTVIVHINGEIIYINQAGVELLGLKNTDEIIGSPLSKFIHPDYIEIVNQRIEKMNDEGKSVAVLEEKFIRLDGGVIDVETAPMPFIYYGKQAILVVIRDITERKKMEEKLINAAKLDSLSIIAGTIAHDFNNILTAIVGNISVAKLYTKENSELNNILIDAEKYSMKAKNLTTQLLTFTKEGTPVKKIISIKDLIIENTLFVLRGSNITSLFFIKEDLWPVEVDEVQISQVITNVVINARQAMLKGGSLEINGENFIITKDNNNLPLSEGRYVKVSFKDTGIGISEENLAKIFDPYFTTKEKGSGLGLASTFSIIKKHQGYIEVKSKLNQGACFIFYLPATNKKIEEKNQTSINIPHSFNAKILFMDDEQVISELVQKALTKYGFEVETVENGNDAITKYQENILSQRPYDLVILDLSICEGLGGKETIKELIKINPEIKAILSSGYSYESLVSITKEYGFKDYIMKPYKIDDLIKIIIKNLSE